MKDDILVSICCITYNHENYIKEALESFLRQKTNFKYEIIIHDDASTDGTVSIIKEYEDKYPDIIKPIYQKENQYAKGLKASLIAYQKATGKYIALCEGDDYWNDENKLQIQVDYMESNPYCSFCFHNADILDMQNNKIVKKFLPHYRKQEKYIKKDNIYNAGEIALLNEIPTASYMFRNVKQYPEWYNQSIAGDLSTQLIHTSYGYAYYIDKTMSVYRIGTGQSLMDKWKLEGKDNKKEIKRLTKYIELYININEFTNYKYTNAFEQIISNLKCTMAFIDEESDIDSKTYKEICNYLSFSTKIKFALRVKHKKVYFLFKRIKHRMK